MLAKSALIAAKLSVLTLATCLFSSTLSFAGGFNASLNITDRARSEETGLRHYPGATPMPNKKGDEEGANIHFSLGDYGLKIVAVKLKTEDAKDKVAAFYRKDLERFGAVLDCSNADGVDIQIGRKTKILVCDKERDRVKRGGLVFKAGTRANQRVVSIEPKSEGVEIALVHVEVRGLDDE
jgi:hypothetical protein